jgi:hypothetical protein
LDANVKVIHNTMGKQCKSGGRAEYSRKNTQSTPELLKFTSAKNSRRCKMQMIMQRCRGG